MKLVGISGQLNSGKDTAADRLIQKFGFIRIALADPIKRYGLNVFHFTEEQLWGPSEHRNAFDPRFNFCESRTEGDDAWMAVFHRAETYNRQFVAELFPDSPVMQATAFTELDGWLDGLSRQYEKLSPRIMLQSLGSDWGRNTSRDVWIRHAIQTSTTLSSPGHIYTRAQGIVPKETAKVPPGVVLSDVRFKNELDHIKSNNGFLIRVVRPETDDNAENIGIVGHVSEMEQKSFDEESFNYVIYNDDTLEVFLKNVDVIGLFLTGAQQ